MQKNQEVKLTVLKNNGDKKTKVLLDEIKPYETVIFEPKKYITDIEAWLNGDPANARISFSLNGAFTRMLCGNKLLDGSQMQVTHSNFDYSIHSTNKILDVQQTAFMKIPSNSSYIKKEVVIYPDSDVGNYLAEFSSHSLQFKTGEIIKINYTDSKEQTINFSKKDGTLPSRLVTGLRIYSDDGIIPAECSLDGSL